ncbi:unnamed protein product [Durusdinium trenchii]|uniref:Dol-P-Glc:Glc(2)Man(9)GlcNAc(2)-PP-Dol alpha-1,2-glucosyltransferase n=2 Tax=Durusdinium trenchii TaxID=1381693 RepID=A0ABP0R4B1_9DINO
MYCHLYGCKPALRSTTASAMWIWAALLGHLCCLAPWAFVMRQVEPYMDEIFHIPQAQKYCQGQFAEWDPKITTFPGLYLSSTFIRGFTGIFCGKDFLRLENVVYALGAHVVMYRLLRRSLEPQRAAAQSLLLSLYPIHFFFQALYYTDVGSLFWTLLTHDLATPVPKKVLPGRLHMCLAAASGCAAVLFRQTNAVWVMFTFGIAALQDLQSSKWGDELLRADISPSVLLTFCKALILESPRLLARLGPLLVSVLLFVGFVVQNGSIVVGDHSNHQVAVHWAQLCYLVAVTAGTSGFGSTSALSPSCFKIFGSDVSKRPRAFILALALVTALLHRYSLAHPFLLADNRHYTFYIWNRFLRRPWFKELLAPGYVYAGWYCWRRQSLAQSGLWVLIWSVAAVLTLVPAPLLEPRYWTTPVLMAHLYAHEVPDRNDRRMMSLSSTFIAGVAFMLVNIMTLGIFVYRPFAWPSGEVARFMW